jgi:antirestriction protein ArdC
MKKFAKKESTREQIQRRVTEKILEKLKAGIVPWQSPYLVGRHDAATAPRNFFSKRAYRGVNALLLENPACPFYVTFKQAEALGGNIKKGAHGEIVVFWKPTKYTDAKTGEEKDGLILRYSTVFNLTQTEGIEWEAPHKETKRTKVEQVKEAEELVEKYTDRPKIVNKEDGRAYYSPIMDYINMPKQSLIKSDAEYYSTLFHELAHSTGHSSRLNRKGISDTGKGKTHEGYALEELVAEITATYAMNEVGMKQTVDNSAAYIQHWLQALNNDHSLIMSAASAASKAFKYMIGEKEEVEETENVDEKQIA